MATSVTFAHTAGPRREARAGRTQAGGARVGDESGVALETDSVGPITFAHTAAASPTLSIGFTTGSATFTTTASADGTLGVDSRRTETAFGAPATASAELATTNYRDEVFGYTAPAGTHLRINTRAHRIVHRDEIHGVFAPLDSDIAGLFADESEIDGLIEREDR
jgi:hypothetical protein